MFPWLMLFYCHILEEPFLREIKPQFSYLWSPNCLENFRAYTIDGGIKMLQNSCISQISIKKKKFKTFYEVETVSHLKKIIQPSPTY